MHTHMVKHLIQGLFLLSVAWAVSVSDLAISAIGVVVLAVMSLALLEVGIRIIDERDARRRSNA